jgi:hypothetical protein
LVSLSTLLTAIDENTDELEGFGDGVETLIGATNTALATIAGHVDTLETLIGSSNTKLDTLDASLATLAGFTDGLETLIGATNTALATLAGHVDGLEGFTDGIEGFVDGLETLIGSTNTALGTLAGHVDALETLIGATNTALATLDGRVDGLETLIGSTNTKLDTLIAQGSSIDLEVFRHLDLDQTPRSVKGTAGKLFGGFVANRATSVRYLKLYDHASPTVGTTTPKLTIPLPGDSSDNDVLALIGLHGRAIAFATAISAAVTTGFADADTGTPGDNDVLVNLLYQ